MVRVRVLSTPCEGGYAPGFRNTVGWSRDATKFRARQPHLRFIEAGQAYMDEIAPGLAERLAEGLQRDPEHRRRLRALDAQIELASGRTPRTRHEAETQNDQLLNWARERHELWLEADDAIDAARARLRPEMARFHRRLLRRRAGEPKVEVRIAPEVAERIDLARLHVCLRAFCRLAGPRSEALDGLEFVIRGPRACFDAIEHRINLGHLVDAETIFHELGPALEVADLELSVPALTWRTARARKVDVRMTQHKLRDLHPRAGYGDDESVVLDHFVTDYVGRVYGSGMAEVLSVGLEHFVSSARMIQLYEQDPEHFLLVLGLMIS